MSTSQILTVILLQEESPLELGNAINNFVIANGTVADHAIVVLEVLPAKVRVEPRLRVRQE